MRAYEPGVQCLAVLADKRVATERAVDEAAKEQKRSAALVRTAQNNLHDSSERLAAAHTFVLESDKEAREVHRAHLSIPNITARGTRESSALTKACAELTTIDEETERVKKAICIMLNYRGATYASACVLLPVFFTGVETGVPQLRTACRRGRDEPGRAARRAGAHP